MADHVRAAVRDCLARILLLALRHKSYLSKKDVARQILAVYVMRMAHTQITTADGQPVKVGNRVFSHYTMEEHTILTEPDDQGWFYLTSGRGRELLNGERICSLAHAERMGWR